MATTEQHKLVQYVFRFYCVVAGALILLCLALKLGTIDLYTGGYDLLVVLDVMRMELGFFSAIVFWNMAVFLANQNSSGLKLNRIFTALFTLGILFVCMTGESTTQVASEAASFYTFTYYLAYLKSAFITPSSLYFVVLVLSPALVVLSLGINFLALHRNTDEQDKLTAKYWRYCLFALFGLGLAIAPPLQKGLANSLSYNPLAYLLKTGYFPRHDAKSVDASASYTNWQFSGGKEKKNVVLVILESFRGDVVSSDPQSAHPGLTPFLEDLTKQSLVFDQAFTVVPHTSKALVAIHCGIPPFLGLPIYESTLGIPVDCLPKLLAKQGYDTAYFQSPTGYFENRKLLTKEFGYAQSYAAEDFGATDFERVNYFTFAEEVVLKPTEDWLQKHQKSPKPFLVSYLTGSTHHDYQPPSDFEIESYVEGNLEHNFYLNSVKYTDNFVEQLLKTYKKYDAYENTLFVFVGDHGEAFFEHGLSRHNNILYNEGTRVFYMIHDADTRLNPGNFSSEVSLKQILPTIMDRLTFEANSENMEASVFDKPARVFSSCYEGLMCAMMVEDNYKFIYNFKQRSDELYNLEDDPAERNNLLESDPLLADLMREQVLKDYRLNQAVYDNHYKLKQEDYLDRYDETILYSLDFIMDELNKIWVDQQMHWKK